MKNIISVLTVLAIVFAVSSCGNKKKKESQSNDTHVHEDGSAHENHEQNAPAQESFEVKEDIDAEHKHEGGDHDHDGHKHENGDVDSEKTGHDHDEHGHEHGDETGHDHDHGEHK